MDDRRLWFLALPNLQDRDLGHAGRGSRFLQTLVLDKRRPHNPGSKPKAVPDIPRCPRPCRVPSTDRAHRVDVAKKAIVLAGGEARDSSAA